MNVLLEAYSPKRWTIPIPPCQPGMDAKKIQAGRAGEKRASALTKLVSPFGAGIALGVVLRGGLFLSYSFHPQGM
jgi:hypothetical protein